MHMICYISDYIKDVSQVEGVLKDIIAKAQNNNREKGITGALLFHNKKFVQVIEGQEQHLRDLMARIEKDPRHANTYVLIDTPVETRGFSNWNMEAFDLAEEKKFDADMMKKLTENFKTNLAPRSDTLMFYYKTLLKQKTI